MKKNNTLFLTHILDSIRAIENFVQDTPTKELFISSRKTSDAVLRNFGVIGEAANNMEDAYIEQHPSVAWDKTIAMRNIVIHEYFGVDLNLVWDTIVEDPPSFKAQIEALLNEESASV